MALLFSNSPLTSHWQVNAFLTYYDLSRRARYIFLLLLLRKITFNVLFYVRPQHKCMKNIPIKLFLPT